MCLFFLNRFKHLIQGGPPLQVTPSPHREVNLQSLLTNLTNSNLDKLQVTLDHHSDTKGVPQGCRMGLSLQQKQANKVKKTRSLCQLENRQRLMLGDSFHKDVLAILLYIFFREKSKSKSFILLANKTSGTERLENCLVLFRSTDKNSSVLVQHPCFGDYSHAKTAQCRLERRAHSFLLMFHDFSSPYYDMQHLIF